MAERAEDKCSISVDAVSSACVFILCKIVSARLSKYPAGTDKGCFSLPEKMLLLSANITDKISSEIVLK